MRLRVKKLHKDAIIPEYATYGAACFDLHAISDGPVDLYENCSAQFKTGLSFEVPENHVMLVFSRSGHGFKSGVRLSNCTGVIDSDYRGEVQVKLIKDTPGILSISNGDRIAQAMIIPVDKVDFEEVDELSDTIRGTGGFGSTGA